jgi:hypothetical protein
MAETGEGTVVRLVRFLALGVPNLSRVVAMVLIAAAIAVAFLGIGEMDEARRADLALLYSVLALVSLAVGYAVPWLVRRFLPRR